MTQPDDMLRSLKRQQHALSLTDLLTLHADVPKRTAQRWLNQFIQDKKVLAEGNARARRYRVIRDTHSHENSDDFPNSIPLSLEGRAILQQIDQPLSARKPVGYEETFLTDYQPNKTFYLPAPIREQLHRMGTAETSSFPAGTFAKNILQRLLIDLSWASSQLEGNTYSRLDTQRLIEHAQVAPGKDAIETQMILNHKAAIELLVNHIEPFKFNRYSLLNLHSTLSENLLPNPADEGRLRRHAVEIGQSTYRPLEIMNQIEDMLVLILTKAARIKDPFEQSFFIMVQLPYLQPFADVNKRTSRLMANLPLLKTNLCPLTFLGVPETAYSRAMLGIYEANDVSLLRDLYIWAYERSTQEYLVAKRNMSEPDPLRLAYRATIREAIHNVVTQPEKSAYHVIDALLNHHIPKNDLKALKALITEELKRLHEGVLTKYNITHEQLTTWQKAGKM